jgi:ketosteroid isomerase-like protein
MMLSMSTGTKKKARGELQHQAMREYLEETERKFGPIDPKMLDEVDRAIEAGFEKVDRIRRQRGGVANTRPA